MIEKISFLLSLIGLISAGVWMYFALGYRKMFNDKKQELKNTNKLFKLLGKHEVFYVNFERKFIMCGCKIYKIDIILSDYFAKEPNELITRTKESL